MEPIISPWILYAISVSSAMKGVCGVIGCILAVVTLIMFLGADAPDPNNAAIDGKEQIYDSDRKHIRQLFIASSIFMLLAIILPNQNTGYRMLAASLITPDNIAGAEDHVIEVIDRLAGIIADKMKN
jgi:hypothetical protein